MFLTWDLTVLTETMRSEAISALLRPAAIRRSTRHSCWLRASVLRGTALEGGPEIEPVIELVIAARMVLAKATKFWSSRAGRVARSRAAITAPSATKTRWALAGRAAARA